MVAAILNFDNQQFAHCEQGATFRYAFAWKEANGIEIDLSLHDAKLQIRKNFGGTLITELSITNGKIFVDSNNQFNLYLTPEETDLLPAGSYLYDMIVIKTSDQKVTRILEGKFNVSPAITRW